MLRIRYWLIICFLIVGTMPFLVFSYWASQNSIKHAYLEVEDRHLLLAKNIGSSLEVYYRDVNSVFEYIVANRENLSIIKNTRQLLKILSFRHICIADAKSGKIIDQVAPVGDECPHQVPLKRFSYFTGAAKEGKIVMSPVMAGPDNLNLIFFLHKKGNELVIGALSTDYIQELGKSIAFGEKGHAAIVDQVGNVISHPLQSWIDERKNIAKISPVRRMLNKETGIEQFYSPALKGDMIAGLTHVRGSGWGVMIPQPVIELEQKAWDELTQAMKIFGASQLVIILISLIMARQFSVPLEQLKIAADKIRSSAEIKKIKVVRSLFTPLEHFKVQAAFNNMIGAISDSNAELRKLAYQDPVSGLANRNAFEQTVLQHIETMKALSSDPLAKETGGVMFYIDLDDFKNVNDTQGHQTGDKVIKEIAKRLTASIAESLAHLNQNSNSFLKNNFPDPIIARNGGDEFTIFFALETQLAGEIEGIAKRLIETIRFPVRVNDESIVVCASVGISQYHNDDAGYEELVKKADIAMYHAKAKGKNQYCLYREDFGVKTVGEICRDVQVGIEKGEFELHYQPKISTTNHSVVSCEALVRWTNSEGQFIAPNNFIPAIENNAAIIHLGEFVVRSAMGSVREWQAAGQQICVAVNISGFHLVSNQFAEKMIKIAEEEKVEPSSIELEITEEAVLLNEGIAFEAVKRLRQQGFRIAIDDFGRGYANLTRLSQLNFDTLKIDGPLVRRSTSNKRARAVLEAALHMAKGLGASAVAEGVETIDEGNLMMALGCDYMQGYYFAKPMPKADFYAWLKSQQSEQTLHPIIRQAV